MHPCDPPQERENGLHILAPPAQRAVELVEEQKARLQALQKMIGITLWAIAAKLNACCMLTHRGRSWHVSTVQNLLRRLEKRRLAALAITTSLLSGCATVGSDGPGPMTCPPAIEYSREDWAHAAEELNSLPDGSAVAVKQSHSSQDNLDHVESVGHRDASPNMHARPRRCYDSIH
jgi:hypothetical protein